MKIRYLLLLFFIPITQLFSQNLNVQGTITNKNTGSIIPNANVSLTHLPDSSIKRKVASVNGNFLFEDVRKGRYILRISFIGMGTYTRRFEVGEKSINFGKIALEEKEINLDELEITAQAPVATVKEDTTEYNAGSFKTNPDANAEDLVTKVPGVTVQEGKVKAQGEDVKQVLVDGRPFFGSDPTAALRNLPADVIDKIQVFDQQSEQSRFTGFDDGNRSKTVNLVTRQDRRNGQFGKMYAGYGANSEYKAGGNLNLFSGDQRITLLLLSNNVNEQNFAIEDLLGSFGGGSGASRFGGGAGMQVIGGLLGSGIGGRVGEFVGRMGGGGDMMNFRVTPRGGITTTHAVGLNYSDKWGESAEVSGNYFFNYGDNDAKSSIFRQYILTGANSQTYDELEDAASTSMNHRLNMRIEWKFDTLNSLFIRPRFSAQNSEGRSIVESKTNVGSALANASDIKRSSDLSGLTFANELLYRHKFETRGRTFSISATTDYSHNDGEANLLSKYSVYSMKTVTDSLDQRADLLKNTVGLSGNVSYTEPFSNQSYLQLSYNASNSRSESDKKTFDYALATGRYDLMDTTLSNTYDNRYFTQAVGTYFRYQDSTMNLSFGASYQLASLTGTQQFPYNADIDHSFNDILPNAMLRWKISQDKNLWLNYRTRTNSPSIDQLQNVVDNSNPLQLRAGNPTLKQDYQHNLNARYSAASFMNFTYFFAMLGGSFTSNAIANNTIFAASDTTIDGIELIRGSQLTRPVNIDGAYSVRSVLTYGMPVSWLKSNVNFTTFGNLSRTPGMINNEVNYTTTPSLGISLVLASNISPEIDFTVSSLTTLSYVRNSIQTQSDNDYTLQNSRIRLNWIIWKGIVFTSDVTHQYSSGLSEGYEQNFVLWNAGIAKKFFANDAGELRFTIFDILDQNQSTQRNATELYIEDTQSDVLQRYFLLSFTYTLRNFTN